MPTQEQVRKMVDDHVLVNATTFISNLLDLDEWNCNDGLLNILAKPDYESAARDNGFEVFAGGNGGFYITWEEDGCSCEDGSYVTEQDAWEAACDDNAIEPYQDEAYEWYIVDAWLADRLEKKGEMVSDDIMGFTIWGRCATGQVIYLDDVMSQITSETPWYMRGEDNE